MRTIQEYLKTADTERLIREYFQEHPIEYEENRFSDSKTVAEIRKIGEDRVREYIARLRNLTAKPSAAGDNILFAYKYLKEGFPEVAFALLNKQELIDQGEDASTYSYIYDEQAKIMGFLVSDSEYTQDNIYKLMVDVMFEASFFGYAEENLEEERKILKDAIGEIRSGECQSFTEHELWEKTKRKKDLQEENLERRATIANNEYSDYCRKREMNILRELVLQNESDFTKKKPIDWEQFSTPSNRPAHLEEYMKEMRDRDK